MPDAAYRVDVVGCDATSSPELYEVRIQNTNSEHRTWHTYGAFQELERQLRPRFPQLPSMPDPSILYVPAYVTELYDPANISETRQLSINELLKAVVAVDPSVGDDQLREFLGLQQRSEPFDRNTHTPKPDETGRKYWPPRSQCELDAVMLAAMGWSPSAGTLMSARDSTASPQRRWPCSRDFDGKVRLESSDLQASSPSRQRSSTTVSDLRISRRFSLAEAMDQEEASRRTQDEGFHDFAVVIARDVARVFYQDARIDPIRLKITDVLRGYARKDPALGYTQGMCFAAAAVCLGTHDFNSWNRKQFVRAVTDSVTNCEQDSDGDDEEYHLEFGYLMQQLRPLWGPGFPMVYEGIPITKAIIAKEDPELLDHLQSNLTLDLEMIVPTAWLSVFAKWLPLPILIEIVPFLGKEGLFGFVSVTLLVLRFHRQELLELTSLDEVLPYVNGLSTKRAPEKLIQMCEFAAPQLRSMKEQTASETQNGSLVQHWCQLQ